MGNLSNLKSKEHDIYALKPAVIQHRGSDFSFMGVRKFHSYGHYSSANSAMLHMMSQLFIRMQEMSCWVRLQIHVAQYPVPYSGRKWMLWVRTCKQGMFQNDPSLSSLLLQWPVFRG